MKNKLRTFCILHHGEGLVGSGASLVVATREEYAREMLWQYFLDKQDRNLPLQVGAKSLMEVELLEDSHLSSYPVSTDKSGVRIEYHYPEGINPHPTIVYTDVTASDLADELQALQSTQNNGRGVSCVASIVSVLRRGDISAARAITNNEGDKIRSYPEIEAVLKRQGFVYTCDFD